tara:strand:+ start:1061 stop:1228 length:168 start_codon:yes stop_codon:yes gene_type:complete
MAKAKRKRAKDSKGRFVKDDPSTPENEAYVQPRNKTKELIGISIAILLLLIIFLS